MTTDTLSPPTARVRARARPAAKPETAPLAGIGDNGGPAIEEVAVLGETSDLTPEEAKAKAVEMAANLLALKEASNKALSAYNKAEREMSKFVAANDVPLFAVKSGEKVYDVGVQGGLADEVDVTKLFAEIGPKDAMTLCKSSQQAVTDFGGKPLLAKVLVSTPQEVKFRVKKR